MSDPDCVAFLQHALPRLGLRWAGFRKVRRQVCRRIARRCAELGLADLAAYRRFLDDHRDEWARLDELCRVTISRFGRDRGLWTWLARDELPRLAARAVAAGRCELRAWSAGCGAGEEPYTLAIAWLVEVAPGWPSVGLEILATDIDGHQLARARRGCYPPAALRELPETWRRAAFTVRGDEECLEPRARGLVRFERHDVRTPPPPGAWDLILCRNLAFTYFDEALQRAVARSLRAALHAGGVLVVGSHERLPD